MPANDTNIITATKLKRTFTEAGHALEVLRGVDLNVQRGEWLSILGRSARAKAHCSTSSADSTDPTAGKVLFNGQTELFALRGADLDRYRNAHVGLVFQQYHLLPELSALENVMIGSMLGCGLLSWFGKRKQARQQAEQLLDRVGLKDRLTHRPNKLSGGERQRVAIARALINNPQLLLADEPTGNLDIDTSASIMDLFKELHREGQTLVMVTHDHSVANLGDRTVTLTKGKLEL